MMINELKNSLFPRMPKWIEVYLFLSNFFFIIVVVLFYLKESNRSEKFYLFRILKKLKWERFFFYFKSWVFSRENSIIIRYIETLLIMGFYLIRWNRIEYTKLDGLFIKYGPWGWLEDQYCQGQIIGCE